MSQPPIFKSALLVEDDPNLALAIGIALRKLGIQTAHVTTIRQARKHVNGHPFIVLDRKLPDGDGLDLCEELRKEGFRGTILMLTAAGMTEDKVSGLNRGADDYLPKPFSWEELEARIRALARRTQQFNPPAPEVAQSGEWQVDETRLRIFNGEKWIELTPLEFKLAAHLISANGAIVGREELLKNVWGFNLLPKTRTVDFFLSRLRKHFEKDPEKPRHFLTVRGAGYRFEP